MQKINRTNNFDLIRLLAALQVLFWHGCIHFEGMFEAFYPVLIFIYSLPGVPIFFTISGFLIYHSLLNNRNNLRKYFTNRFLRIYPALWACISLTVFLIIVSANIPLNSYFSVSFFKWLAAQLTFFQFYTTDMFRSWGIGHPNGSLWTITVEIQFYIALPVIALLFGNYFHKRWQQNVLYGIFALVSLTLKIVFYQNEIFDNSLIKNILGVTILNYFYYFCVGILIYINFDLLKAYLVNKAFWWLLIYAAYVIIFKETLDWYDSVYDTGILSILASILLSFLTISAAFTLPTLSNHMVRGNDLSYGIYIFHMPIFNFFMATGIIVTPILFLSICSLVILIAFLSWRFIEKPALQLKSHKTSRS
jgi:peptidoglycan/LPS O-acetylase OafA/YrhL